jgi:plastocyanin
MAAAAAVMALAILGLQSELASAGPSATVSKAKGVDISGFAFHPPTLRVTAGSRVTFTNSDSTSHTATRGGSFNTGTIKPGHSVTVKFAQKGTFAYHCSIHPTMHGKIVVG